MAKEIAATFKDDPRAWAIGMLESLANPALKLARKDRDFVAQQRKVLATDAERRPGDVLHTRLWRIAARYGLVERQRRASALRQAHRADVVRARAVAVPPAHAVGAPIPRPPPLRRPVVALGGGCSETWDPAGAPGL